MSRYSISDVEALTCISAHTLRMWERRYEFLKVNRTDTKIRFYDDDQVRLLLNVKILLSNGYRISKVNELSTTEINQISFDLLENKDPELESEIQGLLSGMLDLDERLFNILFEKSLASRGLAETLTQLIYPFLIRVGTYWCSSKAQPYQEHFISCLIRRKVERYIDELPQHDASEKNLVLFLPAGEYHEVGLLLANYLIRSLGIRTFYLGQNVPKNDLIEIAEKVNPDYFLSVSLFWNETADEFLIDLWKKTRVPIMIAGNSAFELCENNEGLTFLSSPKELMNLIS